MPWRSAGPGRNWRSACRRRFLASATPRRSHSPYCWRRISARRSSTSNSDRAIGVSASKRIASNPRKAWAAFAWFAAFFLCAQLALALVMESWRPELRDPELGRKLALLRARLAEHPDRPLLLMLG